MNERLVRVFITVLRRKFGPHRPPAVACTVSNHRLTCTALFLSGSFGGRDAQTSVLRMASFAFLLESQQDLDTELSKTATAAERWHGLWCRKTETEHLMFEVVCA